MDRPTTHPSRWLLHRSWFRLACRSVTAA